MSPEATKKKNTGLIAGIIGGVVAVIAIVVVVLILILSNGGPKGKYTLTKMTDEKGNDMTAFLSFMGGGEAMYIEFKDGGKCTFNVNMSGSFSSDGTSSSSTSAAECTYTNDTIKSADGSDEEELKYTFENDQVIIDDDGAKMVFTKK